MDYASNNRDLKTEHRDDVSDDEDEFKFEEVITSEEELLNNEMSTSDELSEEESDNKKLAPRYSLPVIRHGRSEADSRDEEDIPTSKHSKKNRFFTDFTREDNLRIRPPPSQNEKIVIQFSIMMNAQSMNGTIIFTWTKSSSN